MLAARCFNEIGLNVMVNKQSRIQKLIESIISYLQAYRGVTYGVHLTLNKLVATDLSDKSFIDIAVNELPNDPYDENTWENWTSKIKEKTGFKGKDLFMPLRLVLTGKSHGPELKYLIPLFNKKGILQNLGKI